MIWGCLINFKICISLETLSTSVTSWILSFSKIFIATGSPESICIPFFTLPKVPSPIVLSLFFWFHVNIIFSVLFSIKLYLSYNDQSFLKLFFIASLYDLRHRLFIFRKIMVYLYCLFRLKFYFRVIISCL